MEGSRKSDSSTCPMEATSEPLEDPRTTLCGEHESLGLLALLGPLKYVAADVVPSERESGHITQVFNLDEIIRPHDRLLARKLQREREFMLPNQRLYGVSPVVMYRLSRTCQAPLPSCLASPFAEPVEQDTQERIEVHASEV